MIFLTLKSDALEYLQLLDISFKHFHFFLSFSPFLLYFLP